jgi:hypothetical protein
VRSSQLATAMGHHLGLFQLDWGAAKWAVIPYSRPCQPPLSAIGAAGVDLNFAI